MLYKFISYLGIKLIAFIEFFLRRFSSKNLITPPWAKELAKRHAVILAEFQNLLDDNLREFKYISAEQARITSGASWKVFILKAYGRTLEENSALCPTTSALCEKISAITAVMFSILEPHTHITPHRGPYAGVLRCQIPLLIPQGDCGIRVEETTHRWQLGAPLIFDDTLDHEAWNRTAHRRVVLFIDYLRPLPWYLHIFNKAMVWLIGHSPFIGIMIKKSR